MGNIKIEKMVLGMVQTNTWFVLHEETKELIDGRDKNKQNY